MDCTRDQGWELESDGSSPSGKNTFFADSCMYSNTDLNMNLKTRVCKSANLECAFLFFFIFLQHKRLGRAVWKLAILVRRQGKVDVLHQAGGGGGERWEWLLMSIPEGIGYHWIKEGRRRSRQGRVLALGLGGV